MRMDNDWYETRDAMGCVPSCAAARTLLLWRQMTHGSPFRACGPHAVPAYLLSTLERPGPP